VSLVFCWEPWVARQVRHKLQHSDRAQCRLTVAGLTTATVTRFSGLTVSLFTVKHNYRYWRRSLSSPWQLLELGKPERSLFVTSNRCIALKNTLGWCAVVFCGCETVHLLPAVLCVARCVHKFDLWLAIKETPKNSDQWKAGNGVIETLFLTRSNVRPPSVIASVKGLYPSCAEKLHSLEQKTVCFPGVTTHCGCIFHSPVAGFSLLVFEVSWSHTTTRHSR
jgi:hypothetical protein